MGISGRPLQPPTWSSPHLTCFANKTCFVKPGNLITRMAGFIMAILASSSVQLYVRWLQPVCGCGVVIFANPCYLAAYEAQSACWDQGNHIGSAWGPDAILKTLKPGQPGRFMVGTGSTPPGGVLASADDQQWAGGYFLPGSGFPALPVIEQIHTQMDDPRQIPKLIEYGDKMEHDPKRHRWTRKAIAISPAIAEAYRVLFH